MLRKCRPDPLKSALNLPRTNQFLLSILPERIAAAASRQAYFQRRFEANHPLRQAFDFCCWATIVAATRSTLGDYPLLDNSLDMV
jgi:hypothetical protein